MCFGKYLWYEGVKVPEIIWKADGENENSDHQKHKRGRKERLFDNRIECLAKSLKSLVKKLQGSG